MYFKGIRNSFPDERMAKFFLQKYYQLLCHGKFSTKVTKLFLVGPGDSGKSSWFAPFEGVIDRKYVAEIVEDGRFSTAAITNKTQVAKVEEWSENTMSADQAKLVTQGGTMSLQQKHSGVTSVNYRSGFFMTSNDLPAYGNNVHSDAVFGRLAVFRTKKLPKKDTSMWKKMRNKCMHIFHYIAMYNKDMPIFADEGEDEYHSAGACYNSLDYDRSKLMTFMSDESPSDGNQINAEFPLERIPSVLVRLTHERIVQDYESDLGDDVNGKKFREDDVQDYESDLADDVNTEFGENENGKVCDPGEQGDVNAESGEYRDGKVRRLGKQRVHGFALNHLLPVKRGKFAARLPKR